VSLNAGTRLGPYEIVAPLGAGGMGEVYRARDTRLDRTVAIKILPSAMADEAARERFEREARAISSLNHPHICALFDVGHEGDLRFLVMEYLDGETLAGRIERGRLTLAETLRFGAQIAAALASAHRLGIVHRDLKPGNVMLTASGAKLLDFGLAKAIRPSSPVVEISEAATGEQPLTASGTLLGTMQYMSPEQLEGRDADARSDIFALGAVLYEMATGRKAFTGRSPASVIAAILHTEPPPIASIAAPPATCPPVLDHLIRRCLAKDPDERWQSATDVEGELKWIADSPAATAPQMAPGERRRWPVVTAAVAVLAAIAMLPFTIAHVREPASRREPLRFFVGAPGVSTLTTSGLTGDLAISPDGTRLALVGKGPAGVPMLWIRRLDSTDPQPLAGTEGAQLPFWSPDGRSLGFFLATERKLRTIELAGGTVRTIADTTAFGGSWGADDVILYADRTNARILRARASGGTATRATQPDAQHPTAVDFWPSFLPDGRHFLFARIIPPVGAIAATADLFVGVLDSPEVIRLGPAESNAVYASGHLLLARQQTLMAQPFDLDHLRTTGDPKAIASHVNIFQGSYGMFSASQTGTLAFAAGAQPEVRQLALIDRAGREVKTFDVPGQPSTPSFSPDGRQAAVGALAPRGSFDVWLIDLARGISSRFTTHPAADWFPVWSPDAARLVFISLRDGHVNLYVKKADGATEEEPLLRDESDKYPTSWSADGRFIAYHASAPTTGFDIWLLPMSGDRRPRPFLQTQYNETQAQVSPDGRSMAYMSNESGANEVYVRSFPDGGSKRRMSERGGEEPRWRRDGRELFFLSPGDPESRERRMMALSMSAASGPHPAAAAPLFSIKVPGTAQNFAWNYDVTGDGQRFLVLRVVRDAVPAPVTVMLNWIDALNEAR
jgi:Tol biopolymer transport system component